MIKKNVSNFIWRSLYGKWQLADIGFIIWSFVLSGFNVKLDGVTFIDVGLTTNQLWVYWLFPFSDVNSLRSHHLLFIYAKFLRDSAATQMSRRVNAKTHKIITPVKIIFKLVFFFLWITEFWICCALYTHRVWLYATFSSLLNWRFVSGPWLYLQESVWQITHEGWYD